MNFTRLGFLTEAATASPAEPALLTVFGLALCPFRAAVVRVATRNSVSAKSNAAGNASVRVRIR